MVICTSHRGRASKIPKTARRAVAIPCIAGARDRSDACSRAWRRARPPAAYTTRCIRTFIQLRPGSCRRHIRIRSTITKAGMQSSAISRNASCTYSRAESISPAIAATQRSNAMSCRASRDGSLTRTMTMALRLQLRTESVPAVDRVW